MRFSAYNFAFVLYVVNLVCSRAKRFSPPVDTGNGKQEERDSSIPWHPSLDAVVKCIPGERHPSFPACLCGQYARKVRGDELLEKDEVERELVHVILKGHRKKYYECMWCTMCPDGVIMTDRCRQSHDTQCDDDFKCKNPDHVFDDRIKACRQREDVTPAISKTEAEYFDRTAGNIDATPGISLMSTHPNTEGLHSPNSTQPNWFHIAIIVVIAVGILVGVELVGFLAYLACKKTRYRRSITNNASSTTSLDSTVPTSCSCMATKGETSV